MRARNVTITKLYKYISVSWEPLEPLLFNEDVILKCHIKDCCPEGTQWTGGKTNSLLTLGRVSNDKTKYEELWGVEASYLKIKKFGLEDGDSLYTCFHGFSKHSKNLTINGNNFALMPTEESVKKNFTVIDGYLNANVEFLEVYPEPVCNCTFQKLGITEHINVTSEFFPTTSLFLNGKIHIAHQICHGECLGTIQIDCRIGIHSYKVLEAMEDIQFKWRHQTKNTELCIIYVFVAIILTVFAVILAFKLIVKLRGKFKGNLGQDLLTSTCVLKSSFDD
ncbi:PYG [Mytilus coruscus]|uniref:PYG n=1 Tax=Mytilus coruscus TaxID=42192 RepID=A0A6J8CYA3_MYTCO|nr:PYG [Mytilus coruscus]